MKPVAFESVSIIIATINETFSLRQTVDELLKSCDAADLKEIIIVMCKKTTPECVRTAEEIRDTVKTVPVVLYFQKRPFVGPAYQEAFMLARGSHLVMMSADLETPPECVPDFIAQEKLHPNDITTASRWIKGGSFSGYSKVKWLCNYFFQKIIGLLFWSANTDLTYGFRIFPTALMQKINWEETKHPFFLETALKPLKLGVKMFEVPAKWRARPEGESVNPFFHNFAYFKTAWHVRRMSPDAILLPEEAQK